MTPLRFTVRQTDAVATVGTVPAGCSTCVLLVPGAAWFYCSPVFVPLILAMQFRCFTPSFYLCMVPRGSTFSNVFMLYPLAIQTRRRQLASYGGRRYLARIGNCARRQPS